ncbi:MAG: hypothetical protein QOH63_1611 [Acidobacteriota bacterium]|jgi:hypothetical protein|nr:hypothetical protein [Acidobacteriota bacterium]
MGKFKLKKTKDWKAKLRPYSYRDLFEAAVERTGDLGLEEPEIIYTDQSYFTPERLRAFGEFINQEFAPALERGLVATCVIVHTGLIGAVKEFFSCEVYLTIGSVTTPKGEMYQITEQQARRWIAEKVNVKDLEIRAWLTLDSLEILDMTFLPTIAHVSGRRELENKPIAVRPDSLPRAQPQGPDPSTLPNGLQYKPFVVGQDFLTQLGLETVSINY